MAKPTTIYVFPNPYGHIDHNGALAGGCHEVEERRAPGALPANRKIGASLCVIDGSIKDDSDKPVELAARGDGLPLGIKADYVWKFDASAPIAILATPTTLPVYISRCRENGTPPCLIRCDGPEDLPLVKLAEQRLDAIERMKSLDPNCKVDEAGWLAQFPLDATVKELAELVAKERADAEAKAKADRADAAKKLADAADKKRADDAARAKAALDSAKSKFAKPAVAQTKPVKGA